MSLTVGTAMKALLEAKQAATPTLRLPAAHTQLPENEKPPYILIHDNIAATPAAADAPMSSHPRHIVDGETQVDIVQLTLGVANAAGKRVREFDPLLPDLVASIFNGAVLGDQGTPSRIWGCRLLQGPLEIPTPRAANLTHHTIRVGITRSLATHR